MKNIYHNFYRKIIFNASALQYDKYNTSRENLAAFWNIILLCILAEGASWKI